MTNEPYYLVAQKQLMLSADPVSVMVLISVSILVDPVADIDRQGAVELPCRSESPAKPAWHIIQGCQSSSLHGQG